MNIHSYQSSLTTIRRAYGTASVHSTSTDAQAARLAGLDGGRSSKMHPPFPLWDDGLLNRLTQPLSRIRE